MSGDDREPEDPDRAAILARRRRFVALAISGLATAGCKQPAAAPCLSIAAPNDEEAPAEPTEPEPFIEAPGVPLETSETSESGGESGETGEALEPTPPEVCLKVPQPRPCLNVARPRD